MPVIRAAQSVVHQMHGTSFTSYASPARGSRELCAWRIEIPGGTEGVPHHVSREEVLYVLGGTLRVTVDGETGDAAAGGRGPGARPAPGSGPATWPTGRPPRGSPRRSGSPASCRTDPGSLPRGPAERRPGRLTGRRTGPSARP